MTGSLAEWLTDLSGPLAAHVQLAAAALLLALLIALPLTLLAARNARFAGIVLAGASLIQTIPALALLALFYPILLWLSSWVGGGIPALGFLPALLALSLYAVLPILRNGVTGLTNLNPAIIEAANGMGMSAAQKLRLVELPLVAPVLMAGIRTAAVWTIGAATLSTTVGQPSLGDPIFAGLQTQNWALVLKGCLAAAALALITDGLLATAERSIRRRKPLWAWLSLALLTAGAGAALLPLYQEDGPVVTIGAKNFSEQYILARLIGRRLEAEGYTVRYREGLGSAVIYRALASGDIDVYVDYAGTLWSNEMKRTDILPPAKMIPAIGQWMQRSSGAQLLGSLGFENAYVFAMRQGDAQKHGIRTLDDLARASPGLKLGSDLEFLERPEWASVKRVYPFQFRQMQAFSPTFMYKALDSGRVDAISAFSSDGRIAADKLTVVQDSKGAIPRYDALLLISPRRVPDARFSTALRPLLGRVAVEIMREANFLVDRDEAKRTPMEAAAWLDDRIKRGQAPRE
ncbi:MAG: ABC transporter permease/substrate-binding protein [Sphingobium sp.]|uniref:ABC transporter permease/substrate-binding protein n=1 Tax=Sphingobium sp. TaxID=1912891 RepID=UPI0029B11BB7|nr:ABC transporter permease/substrate-binding protein [Sphingobium sp.]MDX3909249.1 ABC transporter permease/substrate-binding protein [Sphingobium sp.]